MQDLAANDMGIATTPLSEPVPQDFYKRIAGILEQGRKRAYVAVNYSMVLAYWKIGESIVGEQGGADRAAYGDRLIADLSKRLTKDFGKGFDESNLRYMRLFYQAFPICDALRSELSWTHCDAMPCTTCSRPSPIRARRLTCAMSSRIASSSALPVPIMSLQILRFSSMV